jgi:hypothetical protein
MWTAIRNPPQSECASGAFFRGRVERAGIRPSLRFDEPGKSAKRYFGGGRRVRRRYVSFRNDGAIMTVSHAFQPTPRRSPNSFEKLNYSWILKDAAATFLPVPNRSKLRVICATRGAKRAASPVIRRFFHCVCRSLD